MPAVHALPRPAIGPRLDVGPLVASERSPAGTSPLSDDDVERLYRICPLRRLDRRSGTSEEPWTTLR